MTPLEITLGIVAGLLLVAFILAARAYTTADAEVEELRDERTSDKIAAQKNYDDLKRRTGELDQVLARAKSVVREAIAAKRSGGIYIDKDGDIALTPDSSKVTYSFGVDTLTVRMYDVNQSALQAFYGTTYKTPEQRIADLSAENNQLNEKLATEKERSKHLTRWLKLLIDSRVGGVVGGVTERQLAKQDYRHDLREELLDGVYSLRIRKHGLPDDVAEHKIG
jgi:hypothetical protein